jgi:Tat protein secretion system quality control protein TatD with DNase activity
MTPKQLNAIYRRTYDNEGTAKKLVAKLPASRFLIETDAGAHRIYDTQPASYRG